MKKFLVLFSGVIIISCNNNKTNNPDNENTAASEKTVEAKSNGEQLYKINCTQCHKATQDFTGPALKGAADRWADKTLLHDFVRNSQAVIAKDAYAKQLFAKWNSTIMQPFSQLSDNDIDAILDYCNNTNE